MRHIIPIFLCILFITSCASSTTTQNTRQPSSDEVFRNDIIGYWADGDSPYAVAAYLNDGVYEGWLYNNRNKEKLINKLKGKWWIKDGQLFEELTEITPSVPNFQPGIIVVDQIVEITKDEMTLIDEEGTTLKKIRVK